MYMSPREYATGVPIIYEHVRFSFSNLVLWTPVQGRGVDGVEPGIVFFPSFDMSDPGF